jgi:hypothetical protein
MPVQDIQLILQGDIDRPNEISHPASGLGVCNSVNVFSRHVPGRKLLARNGVDLWT